MTRPAPSAPRGARSLARNTARTGDRTPRETHNVEDDDAAQPGIQSVEIGMRLLSALVELTADAPPPMLKTLAAAAGMAPAKAHRYIVSLLRCDLVEREPATGRLRLGPMARHIGLSAIRNLDAVKIGSAQLPRICADLGQSVALAIWAYHGPTIVAVEDVRRPVTVSTRVGEVMPLRNSATGRVFGAWMPRAVTQKLLDQELQAARARSASAARKMAAETEHVFAQTRKAGIGWTAGGLNPTINALSAPIFDFRGSFVAALSALGPASAFNISPKGKLAHAVRAAAAQISQQLGYRP